MDNENQPQPAQPTTQPTTAPQKNNILVPAAIIIAGALIAVAVFFSHTAGVNSTTAGATQQAPTLTPTIVSSMVVAPVTSADHILGSPTAKIEFIEYSDLECPFCKVFQPIVQQLYDQYSTDGTLAWVFRDFPLYKSSATEQALHPRAEKEAEASECANQLGGNTTFWAYINKIFSITPSNNGLDPAQLPVVAGELGLNVPSFNACLSSGKYTQFISDSYDRAVAAGGEGTPYSVMLLQTALTAKEEQAVIDDAQTALTKVQAGAILSSQNIFFNSSGTEIGISGALPYSVLNAMVQVVLTGK